MLGKMRAGGEGDDRGWDGWMASPTQRMRVWINSGIWWWTGRSGVLQSMGLQRVGHDWVTELNWTECSTFTASFLRIWNSSTGIPSPPLALFVVMLPKAYLTLHSRMSGSRWVWTIIPSWLLRHYAKWNKPVTKRKYYMIPFIWSINSVYMSIPIPFLKLCSSKNRYSWN